MEPSLPLGLGCPLKDPLSKSIPQEYYRVPDSHGIEHIELVDSSSHCNVVNHQRQPTTTLGSRVALFEGCFELFFDVENP